MPLRPRAEIERLARCPHGGPNYAELSQLGVDSADILDFSVSANPFGPPPEVSKVIKDTVIDRYPDSESGELKRRLAQALAVTCENLIIGNGSMELIRMIASAYFDRGDTVLIIEPTFGEYEIACRIAGSQIIRYRTEPSKNFQVDVNEILRQIQAHHPKGIFLCNPNNPTGQYLDQEEAAKILSVCENALLILDEAYIAFTENPWRSLEMINDGNLLILRSMTKDYALAGLRLGYAISSPSIIETMRKVCPPWNVNAVAQLAGIAALKDTSYLPQSQEGITEAKAYLLNELGQLGFPPLPSRVHYFLLRVDNATAFRRRLLRYGIMVRDCSSFGLPQYVRIAPRTLPECRKLVQAVREIATCED